MAIGQILTVGSLALADRDARPASLRRGRRRSPGAFAGYGDRVQSKQAMYRTVQYKFTWSCMNKNLGKRRTTPTPLQIRAIDDWTGGIPSLCASTLQTGRFMPADQRPRP